MLILGWMIRSKTYQPVAHFKLRPVEEGIGMVRGPYGSPFFHEVIKLPGRFVLRYSEGITPREITPEADAFYYSDNLILKHLYSSSPFLLLWQK